MLAVQIGPVALPSTPLLLLLSLWGASWLAGLLARRMPADAQARKAAADSASQTLLNAGFVGLLVARLAHLGLNANAYLATPWSALDVRDSGWQASAGVAAGLAWLLWRGWRSPELRRALAGSATAGLLVWQLGSAALGLQQQRPLPDLPLQALADGQSLSLTEAARGRPLVINLWASWCGPCRAEMPVLAAAAQRDSSIGFLFVNQGESAAAVRAYLKSQRLQLPEVLLDTGSQLGPALGSTGLPSTFFYDAQGRLVDAHLGVLNAAALQSRLRLLRP